MKRTRWLSALLAIVLVTALVLAGCAKTPTPTTAPAKTVTVTPTVTTTVTPAPKPTTPAPTPTPTGPQQPWDKWPVTEISKSWGWPEFFVTNGVGTRYADAVAMAELLKKYTPMKTQVAQIGSGTKGVVAVLDKQADWQNAAANNVGDAYLGVRDLATFKPGQVAVLAMGKEPTLYGMIARTGSGINSPADLKGKRVAYAPTIPLFNWITDAILAAYGMSKADVQVVEYTEFAQLATLLKEGRVDMGVSTASAGAPQPTELTTIGAAYLVSIGDKIDAVVNAEIFGGLFPKGVLPAGSFKGQDKDVAVVESTEIMHIRTDHPESLAYTIVRVLWEQNADWKGMASSIGKSINSIEAAVNPVKMPAAFHPGAVRYYKEKGVWGAAQEAKQKALEDKMKARLAEWEKTQKK